MEQATAAGVAGPVGPPGPPKDVFELHTNELFATAAAISAQHNVHIALAITTPKNTVMEFSSQGNLDDMLKRMQNMPVQDQATRDGVLKQLDAGHLTLPQPAAGRWALAGKLPPGLLKLVDPHGAATVMPALRPPGFLDAAHYPVSPRADAAYAALNTQLDALVATVTAAKRRKLQERTSTSMPAGARPSSQAQGATDSGAPGGPLELRPPGGPAGGGGPISGHAGGPSGHGDGRAAGTSHDPAAGAGGGGGPGGQDGVGPLPSPSTYLSGGPMSLGRGTSTGNISGLSDLLGSAQRALERVGGGAASGQGVDMCLPSDLGSPQAGSTPGGGGMNGSLHLWSPGPSPGCGTGTGDAAGGCDPGGFRDDDSAPGGGPADECMPEGTAADLMVLGRAIDASRLAQSTTVTPRHPAGTAGMAGSGGLSTDPHN